VLRLLCVLLLTIASPAIAAERAFSIDGESFDEADIVDARALPQMDAGAVILITFSDAAAKRIATMTSKLTGKTATIVLDGQTISTPRIMEPVLDGAFQIGGGIWSVDAAIALAKKISGKDPLPESLEE
jgi:preprotein translocase subunit SecD